MSHRIKRVHSQYYGDYSVSYICTLHFMKAHNEDVFLSFMEKMHPKRVLQAYIFERDKNITGEDKAKLTGIVIASN